MNCYYSKYLKYKEKYLELKKILEGGAKPESYEQFIYNFINHNKELFDLNKYKKESLGKIDINLIDQYLIKKQECSYHFIEFIKFLHQNTIFIGCEEIIDKIRKNINLLKEKYSGMEHRIYIPKTTHVKSNFFFILYFIFHYNIIFERNIKINFNEFKPEQLPTTLFILCDDVIYSGTQISEDIQSFIIDNPFKNMKYNIFLNIFGYTIYSLGVIKSYETILGLQIRFNTINKSNFNIIFPDYLLPYDNILIILIKKFIKTKNITFDTFYKKYNMFIIHKDGRIRSILYELLIDNRGYNTHLIYLFYKYPDGLSTLYNLCKLLIYNHTTTIININSDFFKSINFNDCFNGKKIYLENIKKYEGMINDIYEQNYDSIIKNKIFNSCKSIDIPPGYFQLKNFELGKNNIYNKDDFNCQKIIIPFYKTLNYVYNDIETREIVFESKKYDKITLRDIYNNIISFYKEQSLI